MHIFFKDYVPVKANLDSYNSLTDLRKHIQNEQCILTLVTLDNDVMCKVFPTTSYKYDRVWYHILKSSSIINFYNLNVKVIPCFNIAYHIKRQALSYSLSIEKSIFSTTSYWYDWVWYHILKSSSIINFYNLNVKLIPCFSTCIPYKNTTIKLFVIT